MVTLALKGPMTKRINECAGVACGWLIYNETKNNCGRWREPEVRGDRAKQRRRAARKGGA